VRAPERFRVGAYGLLVESGQVLVTRTRTRADTVLNFPGGALELGEGALEALHREFAEETGLTVAVRGLAYASEHYHQSPIYPENQLVKIYWFVDRTGGELRLEGNGDDIEACRWIPKEKLPAAGLTPADTEMVIALRDRGLW
jgi:8-oxo-dGTP diphosphatase